MVKKKIKKNVVKTKSLNFKIPESFSGLSFNQKIIAVILIVLVIGIISSFFPGDSITGMQVGEGSGNPFGEVFNLIENLLSGVNGLVKNIFGAIFPSEKENTRLLYARLILFSIIVAGVFLIMRLTPVGGSDFFNMIIGIAVAYLSSIYMPTSYIVATGILYSSTVMYILLAAGISLLVWVYTGIENTRMGYVLKAILALIIMLASYMAINDSPTIGTIFLLIGLVLFGYALWKAKTITGAESTRTEAVVATKPVIAEAVYEVIRDTSRQLTAGAGGDKLVKSNFIRRMKKRFFG